jgi:hypothetical protein
VLPFTLQTMYFDDTEHKGHLRRQRLLKQVPPDGFWSRVGKKNLSTFVHNLPPIPAYRQAN